jgi:putative peptidoglycan lipid II flippase
VVFGLPTETPIEAATTEDDVNLRPGATIAGGRYRLLVFHGGPDHLQFWHAMDTSNDRQVALTFVDPDATLPDAQLQEILARTLKLSRIDSPGVARILDVALTGSGGVVISEWIRGGSLVEVAAAIPSPIGAARAAQTLAAAAEAAHRSGVGLSVDHPGRVRVSVEGDVVLAFPATMLNATPEDDTRGIGAVLYALLTDRWPLPETGVASGFAPAILDPTGQPLEPRLIDRDIPFQISAAAFRAVQEGGGIRSAPTLLNLLRQATAVADRTELITPVDEPEAPAARRRGSDREPRSRRRKGLLIGLTVGGLILTVALVAIGLFLNSVFSDVSTPLNKQELGLNTGTTAPASSAPTGIVKPVGVVVFSPEGDADKPDIAGLAIDGDPATAWQTDDYTTPDPFPAFKNGLGLLLKLPKPTVLASVTVNLNGTGTSIQIRSSDTADPSTLENTTELSPATPMTPGNNTITLNNAPATSNVLVWISKLGTLDGKNAAAISEITLNTAG